MMSTDKRERNDGVRSKYHDGVRSKYHDDCSGYGQVETE